ncbi:MAG: DUF308 domain-containing protein [Anaerolineales bacterium]|nr:DUF308 domain-containing protein [Anaerolineales bacterium]
MKSLQGWYIYVIRGVFAILLGTLLFTQRAQWNVIQYMGMFWLTMGLTNIAWARSRGREIHLARWSLVAGILGVVAGVIAILRPLLAIYFSTLAIVLLLGVLVIIIGILHIFGGFRISLDYGTQWAWGSYLVGSVQVILGIIVIIYPWEPIPVVWLIAGTWCIITGILLLFDARRLRTQAIVDKDKIKN